MRGGVLSVQTLSGKIELSAQEFCHPQLRALGLPPCGIPLSIAQFNPVRSAPVWPPANTCGKAACDCFMQHNTCLEKSCNGPLVEAFGDEKGS